MLNKKHNWRARHMSSMHHFCKKYFAKRSSKKRFISMTFPAMHLKFHPMHHWNISKTKADVTEVFVIHSYRFQKKKIESFKFFISCGFWWGGKPHSVHSNIKHCKIAKLPWHNNMELFFWALVFCVAWVSCLDGFACY